MKKIHYFSGLTLSVFVGLHLFNHLISVFGVDSHIVTMDILRKVYRNPIIESILLAAVILQIWTGLRLFFSKRKLVNGFYEKLQLWTGFYLALFFIIHVGSVLTGRYAQNLDTNFYFGAAGLNSFPLNLYFVPYYSLAILTFFGHIAAIHAQKMKKSIFGLTVAQQSNFILIKGILITLITLYGLTDGFVGIDIPDDYLLIGK